MATWLASDVRVNSGNYGEDNLPTILCWCGGGKRGSLDVDMHYETGNS